MKHEERQKALEHALSYECEDRLQPGHDWDCDFCVNHGNVEEALKDCVAIPAVEYDRFRRAAYICLVLVASEDDAERMKFINDHVNLLKEFGYAEDTDDPDAWRVTDAARAFIEEMESP